MSVLTADSLHFAKSSSTTVGTKGDLMGFVRKHADNIYGGLSVVGDAGFLAGTAAAMMGGVLTGPVGWLTLGAALSYCIADIPILFSGDHKKNSLDDPNAIVNALNQTEGDRLAKHAKDALDPVGHPVEVGSLLDSVAGLCMIGVAAATMGTNPLAGVAALGWGGIELYTQALDIFSRNKAEKAARDIKNGEEPLVFKSSTSQDVGAQIGHKGIFQWVEDNPEIASGILGLTSSAGALVFAIGTGAGVMTIASMGLWVAASALFTAFVRNERQEEVQNDAEKPAVTHVKRLMAEGKYQLGSERPRSFASRLEQEYLLAESAEPSLA